MKTVVSLFALPLLLVAVGCSGSPSSKQGSGGPDKVDKKDEPKGEEAVIRAALDKLDPEDRKLAEAQKFCSVHTENRLGSMGEPVKLTLKGQPVFLCCKSCKAKAEREPDKSLANVEALKAGAAGSSDK